MLGGTVSSMATSPNPGARPVATAGPAVARPRVSIGLPVYNGEPFLAAAIDALLAQTFTDFELIISDNASTDGTEAICRERAARDRRIVYVRFPVNRGATYNFNHVLELARGEYFKWAAHDDLHEPEFLERCVDVLDRHPDVVLAFTGLVDIDEHDARRPFDSPALRWNSTRPNVRFRALANPHHRCESVFGVMRADVLRRTFLMSDYAGCDRVLLAQIALLGRFHEVPEPLFVHREHKGRSTRAYKDSQTRTPWFNPSRAGKPMYPHVKMLRNYARAAIEADVSIIDKIACLAMLVPWSIRNRRPLWWDFGFAFHHVMASRKRSAL